MILTSPRNPLLKEVRRAASKGTLTESGFCLAESLHLLEEALRSGCEVRAVIAAESARVLSEPRAPVAQHEIIEVPDALFRELSTTEASQGVMALVRPPSWTLDSLFRRAPALVVVLDGIQDPGNAGAILRAAEAFEASGAMLLKGTANPYNPKALRAAAGSTFRLPLMAGLEPEAAVAALEARGIQVFAAMPGRGRTPAECDLGKACALVVGSEARGVGAAFGKATAVRIPISRVESLNVSVAAAILLYESQRQRSSRREPIP